VALNTINQIKSDWTYCK